MNQTLFKNIRIVLVGTSHPGNIGAAARAMKTMGLSRLYLVEPKQFPDHEATARASGADHLLTSAQVCTSLPEALEGCSLVIATTARMRTLSWPIMEPREMGAKVVEVAAENECAIVFGRERTGLTNEELEHCRAAVKIPTEADFSSLNLAAAVQILSYEVRQAALEIGQQEVAPEKEVGSVELATSDQLEGFYGHLEQTMIDIEFYDPTKPKYLMRRFRRLFSRTDMEKSEVQVMRGLLTASQKMVQKASKKTENKKQS